MTAENTDKIKREDLEVISNNKPKVTVEKEPPKPEKRQNVLETN